MNIILLSFVVGFGTILGTADGTCNVIPIDTWALSRSVFGEELSRPVELVVVTHTETQGCETDDACERLSRSIRNFHMQQGFSNIRLSFLVGGNGKIYEGAGWRIGSHSSGYNENSISLSFLGTFNDELPTQAALNSSILFLDCFTSNGYLGERYMLVGHRQLITTASPGDALQNLIQRWPHWSQSALTRPH